MTGIGMLLKQLGLDPDAVIKVYTQFTEQLPGYLNAIGGKVSSIDARLTALEIQQAATWRLLCDIADKLGVEPPEVIQNDTTVKLIAANGHTNTGNS